MTHCKLFKIFSLQSVVVPYVRVFTISVIAMRFVAVFKFPPNVSGLNGQHVKFVVPGGLVLQTRLTLPNPPLTAHDLSVVVYVTGDVGGPTLVTTQRLTSKRLADRGWIVHPRVNRVCMFDGGVLHGVIPGRGVPPAAVGGPSRGTDWRG